MLLVEFITTGHPICCSLSPIKIISIVCFIVCILCIVCSIVWYVFSKPFSFLFNDFTSKMKSDLYKIPAPSLSDFFPLLQSSPSPSFIFAFYTAFGNN